MATDSYTMTLRRANICQGDCQVPGDKSISHRALLLSAIARGTSQLKNLSPGNDVAATINCLQNVGVIIEQEKTSARIHGTGRHGLRSPQKVLDCQNSGTTMRLMAGLIAGTGIGATFVGDSSLQNRPMRRILEPLRKMGADCNGVQNGQEEMAPFSIKPAKTGKNLQGKVHRLSQASAQVKSCLLLAGLWADGETYIEEPYLSRDHTERMLQTRGVTLQKTKNQCATTLKPFKEDLPCFQHLQIPGDPSSAAFLLGAALLVPNRQLRISSVSINPTRSGFLQVLQKMGANITITSKNEQAGEPTATLSIKGNQTLHGVNIEAHEVPALLDEIPLLAVIATQARGETCIKGARELRYKESDRITQVVKNLSLMGASIKELPDGMVIHGPTPLQGATIDPVNDHRIAMSFAIAGLCASGNTTIKNAQWASISFPDFFSILSTLTKTVFRKEL